MGERLLTMTNVNKQYFMGDFVFHALTDINFTVEKGEFVSILGPSGSGKSTLMNILGCLDIATSGDYELTGSNIKVMTENQLADVRNKKIGFVFQNFQLLKKQSALDNVMLPLIYSGVSLAKRRERARDILVEVGLEDKIMSKPNQLSGGQQQRVSIARALVTNPDIILADEPTGALDQKTGAQIMELFQQLNKAGKTVIMITHDKKIAQRANRVMHIVDGRMAEYVEGDE